MQRYRSPTTGRWLMLQPTAISPRNYEKPTDYGAKVRAELDQQLRYQQWTDFRKGIH